MSNRVHPLGGDEHEQDHETLGESRAIGESYEYDGAWEGRVGCVGNAPERLPCRRRTHEPDDRRAVMPPCSLWCCLIGIDRCIKPRRSPGATGDES